MKVYILWYKPLHNYDNEPWQIYDVLSSEEKAKIRQREIEVENPKLYKFNIEEWSVK